MPDSLSKKDFANLKSALDEAAIVAITDKKGTITYANKKFCAISKYSLEELIGQNHRIISSGYHTKEFFLDMWRTISGGKVWEGEIRNRAKDGSFYWVNTTIVPFLDANGKPDQYVAVRYEITERKMAEEQLQINAIKLEMSNRELQDFASVAAHDLQEPLRKIQSFSDRLISRAKSELSPENKDYLERIQNSAKRMATLISDLLAYSRVTTRAQPFLEINLNDIIKNVVSDLEIRIDQSKGKVEYGELGKIQADALQMHQLFLNLVNNALKFHKPGESPVVRIATKTIEVSKGRKCCQISIQDNGIGFDEKYLNRIFTIFQRLHGRQEYEGTGVGLAVCRKIVDRHGGSITAKSIPGEGATFLVSLPLTQFRGEDTNKF